MTNIIDRAFDVIHDTVQEWPQDDVAGVATQRLADAGLLAPDLPELSESSEAGVTAFGQVYIRYGVDDLHMTPAEAREIAYALLAAADHAEGVGHADA